MSVQAWQKRRLRRFAGDARVRTLVVEMRSAFGLTPERRRRTELEAPSTSPRREIHTGAFGTLLSIQNSANPAWFAAQIIRFAARAETEIGDLVGADDPQEVVRSVLLPAMLTDFDGAEFELFCELVQPTALLYWHEGHPVPFDVWRALAIRPRRIYLDVTNASAEDPKKWWRGVRAARAALGLDSPRAGLPLGTRLTRGAVGRGTAPWSRWRRRVLAKPDALNKIEEEYVKLYIESKSSTPLSTDRHRKLRRQAVNNFRRNVLLDSAVQAVLPRRRRPGRPTKSPPPE